MKKWIFILLASTGFAALPPLAQGIREYEALLSDPKFYQFLGSAETIRDILRTDHGFLVFTEHYVMKVDVLYRGRDQRLIGPAQFELVFEEPIDLRGR
jgi:hypothetical protein